MDIELGIPEVKVRIPADTHFQKGKQVTEMFRQRHYLALKKSGTLAEKLN